MRERESCKMTSRLQVLAVALQPMFRNRGGELSEQAIDLEDVRVLAETLYVSLVKIEVAHLDRAHHTDGVHGTPAVARPHARGTATSSDSAARAKLLSSATLVKIRIEFTLSAQPLLMLDEGPGMFRRCLSEPQAEH